jgi:3-keto-5-aminohexanoate cleavage enzyme
MAEGVWLEAALNGPWTRQRQPGIPVTRAEIVEQAVACADAGAAIVHLHAYDEGSGRPREAYDLYAPVFEAIRSRRDVICYPTPCRWARARRRDRPRPGRATRWSRGWAGPA